MLAQQFPGLCAKHEPYPLTRAAVTLGCGWDVAALKDSGRVAPSSITRPPRSMACKPALLRQVRRLGVDSQRIPGRPALKGCRNGARLTCQKLAEAAPEASAQATLQFRKHRAEGLSISGHCADCAGEVLSVMKGILWDAAMCQGPSHSLRRSGGHGSEKWPRLHVSSRESTSESRVRAAHTHTSSTQVYIFRWVCGSHLMPQALAPLPQEHF